MTQDEIIEMAIKAKILQPVSLSTNKHWRKETIRELTAFVKLVAQNEREACAKVVENILLAEGADVDDVILRLAEDIRAREQA
jgi:predicted nucleic-acid-binding protein